MEVGIDRWVTRIPNEWRLNVLVACSATMAGFSQIQRSKQFVIADAFAPFLIDLDLDRHGKNWLGNHYRLFAVRFRSGQKMDLVSDQLL